MSEDNNMKRVAELEGAELDYWVYRAAGGKRDIKPITASRFSPSTWWADGGPIIERERISITDRRDHWFADAPGVSEVGPTPLIAAMRAFVASRLGKEVAEVGRD